MCGTITVIFMSMNDSPGWSDDVEGDSTDDVGKTSTTEEDEEESDKFMGNAMIMLFLEDLAKLTSVSSSWAQKNPQSKYMRQVFQDVAFSISSQDFKLRFQYPPEALAPCCVFNIHHKASSRTTMWR